MRKLIKVVSTFKNGVGGHYYSLLTIAELLTREFEVVIINIGHIPSPVLLKHWGGEFVFLNSTNSNINKLMVEFRKAVESENPIAIHTYDLISHLFVRTSLDGLKCKLVHTKCGGPPVLQDYGNLSRMVVFTREDQEHLADHGGQRIGKIHRIENRIGKVSVPVDEINQITKKYALGGLTILRICRISRAYRKSIISGIRLVEFLKSCGYDCKLVVIGTIQDDEVFQELSSELKDVVWLTSDEFTCNASRLLGLGDIVIGTGRSFMEAALIGLLTMVPSDTSFYPVPVLKLNFEEALAANFSPRYEPSGVVGTNEFIEEFVLNSKKRKEASKFMTAQAKLRFSIESASQEYFSLYDFDDRLIKTGFFEREIDRLRLKRFYSNQASSKKMFNNSFSSILKWMYLFAMRVYRGSREIKNID